MAPTFEDVDRFAFFMKWSQEKLKDIDFCCGLWPDACDTELDSDGLDVDLGCKYNYFFHRYHCFGDNNTASFFASTRNSQREDFRLLEREYISTHKGKELPYKRESCIKVIQYLEAESLFTMEEEYTKEEAKLIAKNFIGVYTSIDKDRRMNLVEIAIARFNKAPKEDIPYDWNL